MAPETPLPIRIAQTVGISSSLILSGAVLGISVFSVPRLLESPTPLLLRQWKNMFESGRAKNPALAVVSAATYFWLAYDAYTKGAAKGLRAFAAGKAGRYLAAGLLVVGIVPFTVVVLKPTNLKLLKKADETQSLKVTDGIVEAGLGEETAHKLVDWWGVLNLFRGGLLVLGGGIGLWTTLN